MALAPIKVGDVKLLGHRAAVAAAMVLLMRQRQEHVVVMAMTGP